MRFRFCARLRFIWKRNKKSLSREMQAITYALNAYIFAKIWYSATAVLLRHILDTRFDNMSRVINSRDVGATFRQSSSCRNVLLL